MKLSKSTVNLMTHVVACGTGSFDGRYRNVVKTLLDLAWITCKEVECKTIRKAGNYIMYVCAPTEQGRRAFAEYVRKSKWR